MKISLGFLSLGILGLLWNMWVGWNLAQVSGLSPDTHLVSGLSSLAILCIGSILGIRLNERNFDQLQRVGNRSSAELRLQMQQKQNSQMMALGVVGLSVVSTITGTISHSGKFPLLHFLLVIALLFLSVSLWMSWSKQVS